jgi:hypothetical protein
MKRLVPLVLALAAPLTAEAGVKLNKLELNVPGSIMWLTTADLDGDTKTDLVLSYRRGSGPRAQKFIAVFFRRDDGYGPHPDVAIAAPRAAAVFDTGDAQGQGRDQILYLTQDGVYAQPFIDRKPQSPAKVLSVSSLAGEPEEEDLIHWDFLREIASGETAMIIPTRTGLKLYKRTDNAWKVWSKINIEQLSAYDAEMSTFRRDRRGGSSGRPFSFRATTIVPLLEFVDQTGDGKIDLVTLFEDRVATYPRLEDGTISSKPSHAIWFQIRTAAELENHDAGVHTQVLDLDRDGIADACITKIAGGITTLTTETHIHRGLKGGGFEERPSQVFKDDGFAALTTFVDADGDGRVDMIQPISEVSIMAISQMMLRRELTLGARIRRPTSEKPLFFEKEESQRLDTVFGLDLTVGATLHGMYPIFGYDFDGDGVPDVWLSQGGGKMVLHKGVRQKREMFEEEGGINLSAPGTSTTLAIPPTTAHTGRPDLLLYYVDRADLAGKIFVFTASSETK